MNVIGKFAKNFLSSSGFYFRRHSTLSSQLVTGLSSEFDGMKLDSPQFRSLFTPELELVINLFKKYQYELRIAGGAVRDLLLNKVPADIDFATTATPIEMMEIFEKENVRMLNKKGEKHGTVTCRINDKENFEITTLRIDRVCDGRHAEVEFTTDWVKDANRRDLTVNSLFLGFDGTVYDYFGGCKDLEERRIAFVGDANQRIQEDYLRILRYFRFYGRLAKEPNKHEEETITAICLNVQGLLGISGERLWTELKKIAVGRFAGPIMRTMLECNVGQYVGLPSQRHTNIDEFERVWNLCKDLDPKPMTMMSALFYTDTQVLEFDKRLKLSNKERSLGIFIVSERNKMDIKNLEDNEKYFRDLILDQINPQSIEGNEDNVYELLKYHGLNDLLCKIKQWQVPKFPINGGMMMAKGVRKGPAMKVVLGKLFNIWKESNYTATTDELLSKVDEVYTRDRSKSPNKQK